LPGTGWGQRSDHHWFVHSGLRGAIIGTVDGFSTTVFWVMYIKPYTYDLLEIIPGFIVGMI